jgi:SAM-dependent methyltransferase
MAWNADDYRANAAFVPALGADVLALLDARPGERILDLGCGDGALTSRIVDAGADVVGLEPDPSMRAAATARGIVAIDGDGQALGFDRAFDAVFTNAALHWMPDQAAVAAGVFRALKPGGRYVGECGGFMNIAAIRAGARAVLLDHGYDAAALGNQVYQTPEAFTARHEAAGFTHVDAHLIPRPTPLPTGIRGWLKTFRAGFLAAAGAPPEREEAVTDAIEAVLRPILTDEDGHWTADYVRLRWRATRPESN